jgi:catechol 2,3-dioxygenase-like lactoylglutathione lyase family enzyme
MGASGHGGSHTVFAFSQRAKMTPGLDHLSFAVPDRGALERWCERLEELGVDHSPVAEAESIADAAVVVFRDPDNIQLELFVDPTRSTTKASP